MSAEFQRKEFINVKLVFTPQSLGGKQIEVTLPSGNQHHINSLDMFAKLPGQGIDLLNSGLNDYIAPKERLILKGVGDTNPGFKLVITAA